MAIWREKINLNQVIAEMNEQHDLTRYEEPCPQEVLEALAAEIRKSDRLAYCGARIMASKSIAELNRNLEQVFDLADRFGVWCGL